MLTTRLIFDHVRAVHPEVPLEDQLTAGLLDSAADATLAKAQLRAEIRIALREAFAVLTDRQKLLLLGELRGTPLSAIAATYQVHVRSMQRWVRDAHDVFLAEFRCALARRLQVAPGELSSVLTFANISDSAVDSHAVSGRRDRSRNPRTATVGFAACCEGVTPRYATVATAARATPASAAPRRRPA